MVKLKSFRREFENLNMKSEETIQDYFSRVSILIKEMRNYGEEISERKVVEKILRCLPQKFNYVVAAIRESKDLSTYTQNGLMGSLIAHEERMEKIHERSLEEVFQTKVQVSKGQSKQECSSNYTQLGRDVDVDLVDVVAEDSIKEVNVDK